MSVIYFHSFYSCAHQDYYQLVKELIIRSLAVTVKRVYEFMIIAY